jgi:hypothetical protein
MIATRTRLVDDALAVFSLAMRADDATAMINANRHYARARAHGQHASHATNITDLPRDCVGGRF